MQNNCTPIIEIENILKSQFAPIKKVVEGFRLWHLWQLK